MFQIFKEVKKRVIRSALLWKVRTFIFSKIVCCRSGRTAESMINSDCIVIQPDSGKEIIYHGHICQSCHGDTNVFKSSAMLVLPRKLHPQSYILTLI